MRGEGEIERRVGGSRRVGGRLGEKAKEREGETGIERERRLGGRGRERERVWMERQR